MHVIMLKKREGKKVIHFRFLSPFETISAKEFFRFFLFSSKKTDLKITPRMREWSTYPQKKTTISSYHHRETSYPPCFFCSIIGTSTLIYTNWILLFLCFTDQIGVEIPFKTIDSSICLTDARIKIVSRAHEKCVKNLTLKKNVVFSSPEKNATTF